MFLENLSEHEALLRFSVFIVIFIAVATSELLAPRRNSLYSKNIRWFNNLSLTIINAIITKLLLPFAAVAIAMIAQERDLGLLNLVELPAWLSLAIAVVALDLTLYFQHLILHHVPFLWRMHRMHHADLDFDVTAGLRFHPFEIIFSMVIKMAVVFMLGAPVIAVIIFEIILNATPLFNHANINIPKNIDHVLRYFLVTPDMHRVHHSVIHRETNSNFCFNFPWWDYLFKTYRAQPDAGHANMNIGIERFRTTRDLWLDQLLIQPFRNISIPTRENSLNDRL